ncbi:hypothetical protein GCM10010279_18230 [Streptomyces mutabilis]|nr:hypothetical protein GCM10010279_18230 [Streptomyces mutabilis]
MPVEDDLRAEREALDWPGESGYDSAGFRPAWWNNPGQRDRIKPPLNAFSNAANPPNCPDAKCYETYRCRGANVTRPVD